MNKNDKVATKNDELSKKIEMENNRKSETSKMKEEIGEMEDATKYGEFISSYFAWMTLERQKQLAKRMEEIDRKNK